MPIYTLNSWIFKIQEKKISIPLYYSARTAITENYRLGGLNNRIFTFSWFGKLEVQDQGANKVAWFGLLCCKQLLASVYLHRLSSALEMVVVEERPLMSFSPLIRTQVQSDEGPNLVTSLSPFYLHIGNNFQILS